MGLATARACADGGHEVDVVEQGPLPNPAASSWDRSRLIRYTYGSRRGYARMVADAFAANTALLADLAPTLFVETGTLVLVRGDDPEAEASRAGLAALDVPHATLAPTEVARRFPSLTTEDLAWALWTPTGGVLRADALLDALVARLATVENVRLHPHRRIAALDAERGRVVDASGATIAGDLVLVTAGPWTADLLPELAPVARPSRQIALDVATDTALRDAWAGMPMVLDGVASAGSGFYAVPPVAGLALKIGDHRFSGAGHPDMERAPSADECRRILDLARHRLRDAAHFRVADARSCFYTVAPDERFRAVERGAALILTGFSGHGFKFGPLIGRMVRAWAEGAVAGSALAAWLAGDDPELPRRHDIIGAGAPTGSR